MPQTTANLYPVEMIYINQYPGKPGSEIGIYIRLNCTSITLHLPDATDVITGFFEKLLQPSTPRPQDSNTSYDNTRSQQHGACLTSYRGGWPRVVGRPELHVRPYPTTRNPHFRPFRRLHQYRRSPYANVACSPCPVCTPQAHRRLALLVVERKGFSRFSH